MVVVLSLLLAYYIFGVYLYEPNKHMYAFGGDAMMLYYNMIYHVIYGHGTTLTDMNYPFGEYIFLTDAQGALSTTLQWINHHWFDLHRNVMGIVHGLNIYLLPLCAVLLYYILRFFNVRVVAAILFSVLITFLSPPIFRLQSHFGLGYPFIIPMAMLWFLRKTKFPRLEWRDLLVLCVLLFFAFNNPYVGFMANAFLLLAGIGLFLFRKRNNSFRKGAAIIASMGLLGILVPYLNFHFADPVHDRLKEQWGFFFSRRHLKV